MHLKRLQLKNFRCFETLDLDLHPRLTVIVAENGGGKTAIMDAFGYALNRILTRIPGVEGENLKVRDIRIEKKDIQAPFCSIEVETEEGIVWSRSRKRDATQQTAEEVPSTPGDKQLFEYLDPIIHSVASGGNATLPMFAYYGAQRAVLDIPERRRGFKKEFRRFDGLANALEPSTHFKNLFEWFYAQEREHLEHVSHIINEEFLEEKGGAKSEKKVIDPAALRKKMQNPAGRLIGAIRKAISIVVPGFEGPRIKTNPLRMILRKKRADGVEEELSLQMLSDGYRTMLAMIMDFAHRMAQTNPHLENPLAADAIMLVDEIDLHLHPLWQQTVLDSISRAFPHTQFILTTHSPQVISTVPANCIRIIRNNKIYAAPAGTEGAEAQRILQDVFGAPTRSPKTETSKELAEYLRLVDERKFDTPRAVELRKKLNAWSQGNEPALVEADVKIENLKWEGAS